MNSPLSILFGKEVRQITRSRRTVLAAAAVPALMLILVTPADILTLRLGFGAHPIYLLSSARSVSPEYLLRHFTLPVLVTISALVTPSIVMGDLLFGERDRRTLELLVALPVSAFDVVLGKLAAVLLFALIVDVPLFAANTAIVTSLGYGSPTQTLALTQLLLASIAYSAVSALLVALVAGEARAANIVSGLVLGPIIPVLGAILASVPGVAAISIAAAGLALLSVLILSWCLRLISFERLFGT